MSTYDAISSFFNSAVLIDDEVPLGVSVRSTRRKPGILLGLIKTFQEQNIVISPHRFDASNRDAVERAVNLALSGKLTILDWDLENIPRKGLAGGHRPEPVVAKEIIRQIVEKRSESELHWIVIWTWDSIEDIPTKLLAYLSQQVKNTELIRNLETASTQLRIQPDKPLMINGLFITVMSKKDVTPDQLFRHFASNLTKAFGPISVALLGMAGEMEQQSYQVMREFAKPFELSVYLHALTSELNDKEIARFIFRLYADSVLETVPLSEFGQSLNASRSEALGRLISMSKTHDKSFEEAITLLQIDGNPLTINKWRWDAALELLSTAKGWADTEGILTPTKLQGTGISNKELKGFRITVEVLLAFVQWRDFHPGEPVRAFFAELNTQAVRYTKLLKYEMGACAVPVETGSIYFDRKEQCYLLCITPYCDTARPEKVKNHFKFLLGFPTGTVSGKSISQADDKLGSHGTFVPSCGSDPTEFVEWEFFRTTVLDPCVIYLSEWASRDFELGFLEQNWSTILRAFADTELDKKLALATVAGETGRADLLQKVFRDLELDPLDPKVRECDDVIQRSDTKQMLRDLCKYVFVGRMKREYAQQIINKYVAYQSRAGVSELYYKEWSRPLYDLFHRDPAQLERYDQLVGPSFDLNSDDKWWLAETEERHKWFQAVKDVDPKIGEFIAKSIRELATHKEYERLTHQLPSPEVVADIVDSIHSKQIQPKTLPDLLMRIVRTGKGAGELLGERDKLAQEFGLTQNNAWWLLGQPALLEWFTRVLESTGKEYWEPAFFVTSELSTVMNVLQYQSDCVPLPLEAGIWLIEQLAKGQLTDKNIKKHIDDILTQGWDKNAFVAAAKEHDGTI